VWFDAPIGYISATVEWAAQIGDPEGWKLFWQDEDTELVHFIGKDNIVFHCIMFPAMLKEHGDFVLPKNVPANEFLNLEGQKLSTSRGWAVWLHEYLEDFDAELLRYALATTLPETRDSDFSWKDFQGRVNNDLADIFGNFVYRTFSFIERFFDGSIPPLENASEADREMLAEIKTHGALVAGDYNKYKFKDAVLHTLNLARLGNKYFTDMEPWHSRKTDMQKCGNTLHVCAQIVASLSVYFEPVLPETCKRLKSDLNMQLNGLMLWEEAGPKMLEAGHKVSLGEVPFKKIEDERIEAQIEKLKTRAAANAPAQEASYEPEKPPFTFDDFMKQDLRAGRIIDAERIKKSKKLLKIRVDMGYEERTIVSGIAAFFDPETLADQPVVVVANLKPRKMMGIESKGMILMAEDADGSLRFVETNARPGSVID
jgi:methionyl-tRNA synthetase